MRISSRYALVPPLETISTLSSTSPCANSSRPDLSWTEIRARLIIGQPVGRRRRSRGDGGRQLAVEEEPGRLGQQPVLNLLDPGVQRLSRVALPDLHRFLEHDRAGVDALVDEVDRRTRDLDAMCERVLDRVRAGKRRQQRGVHVQDAAGKALEERCRQELHVAREDDELDASLGEPFRELLVPPLSRLELHHWKGGGLDSGPRGPVERLRLRVVGRDRDDRQARVEQRLQVRPLAADEDADHRISPMTSSPPASAAGTTAQKPMPRLKTCRSSASSTCRASQSKTAGRSQAPQSISAWRPSGSTRERLPRMPPPVTFASARTSARPRSSCTSSR